ncbi:MAG: helix-turn-helix transcriptional regulator [Vicinamibacterales bacterium]
MLVSALETLVLDLLAEHGSTYGLDLVAASSGRLKRGSVYVTLGRMEQKGYVTSRLEDRTGEGPPRRLYDITALGHRARQAVDLLRPLPDGPRT